MPKTPAVSLQQLVSHRIHLSLDSLDSASKDAQSPSFTLLLLLLLPVQVAGMGRPNHIWEFLQAVSVVFCVVKVHACESEHEGPHGVHRARAQDRISARAQDGIFYHLLKSSASMKSATPAQKIPI